MITCTRRLEFDAGHRVHNHESKCAHLHGHRYAVELTARTKASRVGGRMTDDVGRVIDFSVLKERIGSWLDECWDHRMLLWMEDPVARLLVAGPDSELVAELIDRSFVDVPFNPTAENMAAFIGSELAPKLLEDTDVEVFRVVVHETPNCQAAWEK